MMSNQFENLQSMSLSSQQTTKRREDVRLRALEFFNADPNEFDLIFVPSTTNAIKLVAECLRDLDPRGFQYRYHMDSCSSIVGVRELANMGSQCVRDIDVDAWISELSSKQSGPPKLLAFPAQSNLNGRRLPVHWCKQIRAAASEKGQNIFSLLDAASFVSTAPLDLKEWAPDFTAASFFKIFGFPDLGALIIRKSAAQALKRPKVIDGGPVDQVPVSGLHWDATKKTSVHERLEDGTIRFHSIIALDAAFETHRRLYGSMTNISAHTGLLAKQLYRKLSLFRHFNSTKVCRIYQSGYGDRALQGPIIAFNIKNSRGDWIPKTDVERLAAAQGIRLRSVSVCNPGVLTSSLRWRKEDIRRQYAATLPCDDRHNTLNELPTGVLRISLGAMTSLTDIDILIQFIEDTYVEKAPPAVFPIRGCGGFQIPANEHWQVNNQGLAWNQEWCLVHEKTGQTLGQEEYPQMALIHPTIYPARRVLRISCDQNGKEKRISLEVPFELQGSAPSTIKVPSSGEEQSPEHSLTSALTRAFFSEILGVPCTLVRISSQVVRQRKLPRPTKTCRSRILRLIRKESHEPEFYAVKHDNDRRSQLVSDESTRLIISQASAMKRRNCESGTAATQDKHVTAIDKAFATEVLRANIVIAERTVHKKNRIPPIKHQWSSFCIGQDQIRFDALDGTQSRPSGRNDQSTDAGSFKSSTRVLVRRADGSILLGRYAAPPPEGSQSCEARELSCRTIAVRDAVFHFPTNG
ncbi:hypothetical protein N7526_011499 [Penicillium atrosanguineum]|nr:hypothetical protein N7526_011499 [Penicillium atrosanguineum]